MHKLKDAQNIFAQCQICGHYVKKTELKPIPKNEWETIQACENCIFENAQSEREQQNAQMYS